MRISVSGNWASFIDEAVRSGQFETPDAVVQAGLDLLRAREAQLDALRRMVTASLEEGGELTDEEVDTLLSRQAQEQDAVSG